MNIRLQKGGSGPPFSLKSADRCQWMLTGIRSFSKAPAMARSRASDSRIGWPLAANSAQSFVFGRNFRKAGKLALQLLAAHFAQIGHVPFAKMSEIGLGEVAGFRRL